jgi:predicted phosphodiesterase
MNRTLLVSDVHLGLASSQPGKVLGVLESVNFDLLVIVGDLFNGNLDAFDAACWRLIDRIRAIHHSKNRSVVLIRGNHDPFLITLLGKWTGIPVYDWYTWDCAGYGCFAIHGHQFDSVCHGPSLLASALTYLQTKALGKHWLSFRNERLADEFHVDWERLTPKVRDGTTALAGQHQKVAAFAGHTHEAVDTIRQGIHYVNTGCMLAETRASYALVDEEGPRLVYC